MWWGRTHIWAKRTDLETTCGLWRYENRVSKLTVRKKVPYKVGSHTNNNKGNNPEWLPLIPKWFCNYISRLLPVQSYCVSSALLHTRQMCYCLSSTYHQPGHLFWCSSWWLSFCQLLWHLPFYFYSSSTGIITLDHITPLSPRSLDHPLNHGFMVMSSQS